VVIGDLKGVTITSLIVGSNSFFLRVGYNLGIGFSFRLKISILSLFKEVIAAFYTLLA